MCVFHVIKDINKLILDAVRRMKKAMSRRGKGGRKKKPGRKSRKAKAAAARRGMTVKEKAYFVFKHRHLIVKRQEDFTEQERDDLRRMLEYLPELATLRRFDKGETLVASMTESRKRKLREPRGRDHRNGSGPHWRSDRKRSGLPARHGFQNTDAGHYG